MNVVDLPRKILYRRRNGLMGEGGIYGKTARRPRDFPSIGAKNSNRARAPPPPPPRKYVRPAAAATTSSIGNDKKSVNFIYRRLGVPVKGCECLLGHLYCAPRERIYRPYTSSAPGRSLTVSVRPSQYRKRTRLHNRHERHPRNRANFTVRRARYN